ncbi:Lipase 4 [Candida viswanathii]|uniref:Lipase 4 n=1 Tax=Candida viswanathii TaxID=5486 RepID=A0A367YRX2_9ASCO|nr:Lipase 4 [Candida viswanathii]
MSTALTLPQPVSTTTATATSATSTDAIIRELFQQYISLNPDVNKPNNDISKRFSLRSLPLIGNFFPEQDEKKKIINELLEYQKSTTSYRSWYETSLKLDELLGNNAWKSDPTSDIYDYDLIYKSLNDMRDARMNRDYKLLLYYIRTRWVRNIGNMGDANLYRHAYVGTKRLIEEYIHECQLSLEYLISSDEVNLDDRYLLGMLIQTRKNIGRTALVLSGGSTFGIFHIGVLTTLFETNLMPRIVSGTSAGSIVASILCCHSNEETFELLNTITSKRFTVFDVVDCDVSQIQGSFKKVLYYLGHLIKYGTIFDIEGLQDTMIGFLGDLTFREAYNRTGKILNITVSPASIHEQTRLLNYLTAPNCLIWSAVCASCSVPGIFPSCSVYEKNPKTNEIHEWNNDESMKFVDGSVDNDLPVTRLLEMFNVDHIIAVQVNPHVVPILRVSVSNIGGDVENDLTYKMKHFLNNVYDFVSSEAIHYLQLLNELDIYKNLSNKAISILSQNYSGDITILPEYKLTDFTKVFENPNPEFLLDFICRGAKASWPKVSIIHNHCSVEFALDKAITILRGRIITSANYRITSGSSSSTDGVKRSQLYYTKPKPQSITLVTSPVMNENQASTAPNTPLKGSKRPLGIQRHHSTSNATTNNKHQPRSKRNSMSATDSAPAPIGGATTPRRRLSKGISTTALVQMNQGYPSGEATLVNDDLEGSNAQRGDASSKQRIRKARSSGNFRNRAEFYTNNINDGTLIVSDRIPYKDNPYYDNAEEAIINKSEDEISQRERANLPSLSRSNSKRNSYIGLNRLKDNNLSRSNNNLYYNLKHLGNNGSNLHLIKRLEQERRGILKNGNRESLTSLELFGTSDDDDFCNLGLSNNEGNPEDDDDEDEDEEGEDHEDERHEDEEDEDDQYDDDDDDSETDSNQELKSYEEGDDKHLEKTSKKREENDIDEVAKVAFESVRMNNRSESVVDDINPYFGN